MKKQCDCQEVLDRISGMIKEAEKTYEELAKDYTQVVEENKKSNTRAPEVKREEEYKAACLLNAQWGGLNALRWEYQELKKLFGYEKNMG